MTELRYLAPTTLDEAIGAFAAAGSAARILAGGTDLLVQMRSGVLKPGVIVDIKKIPEMTEIEQAADGSFRIGAAVSGMALHDHENFGKVWPGVLEAVNLIGSKQVQGRASAGGNLCNGSPAGDSVPAMVAAGAVVTVQGPNGRRELKVEDVPAGPGRTNLKPGEILVSFKLPPRPPGSSDAYLRMIPRTEMDIAVVGVGVSLTIKDGVCHRRPRRPRRGGADRAAGGRRRESADRQPSSTTPRWQRPPPPVRPPAVRSTTSAAPSPTAPRSPACCSSAPPRSPPSARPRRIESENNFMAKVHVTTSINGEPMEFLCEPNDTMLDALRGPLSLTGSKEGCASGDCGACSITLDDSLVCSCLMLAVEAEGHEIRTIEGLASGDKLHPLQQKFLEMAALQCGICTSGMLVASDALLRRNPKPSEEEVRFWLAGNLCRCTGYDKIVRAVMETAAEMRAQ